MKQETFISEYVRINRIYEKRWFPRVKKAIGSKISSLIVKLREDGIEGARRYLSVDIGNFQLTKVIKDMYAEVGLRHAGRDEKRLMAIVRAEPKKSMPAAIELKGYAYADTWLEFIQNYLERFLISNITFKVSETTRNELLKVLNEAVERGWGVDEIVNHLQQMPFTAYQSARIVRTEINRAGNVGVYAQGQTFAYELQKEWISVRDNRTRGNPDNGTHDHADHWDMNGQTVDFFDVFRDPKNGHELQFPGDPEAAAEDTIFCRCQHFKKPKRDENGRLVPRKSRIHVELPRNRNRTIITI
jgi:hypothetical protein